MFQHLPVIYVTFLGLLLGTHGGSALIKKGVPFNTDPGSPFGGHRKPKKQQGRWHNVKFTQGKLEGDAWGSA